MNSTQKTLTNLTDERGNVVHAGPGATAQADERLTIKICGECQSYVVFVKSTRTGKFYLADVFRGHKYGFYYVKASPHFKTCQKRAIEFQIVELEREVKELHERHMSEADAIHDQCVAAGNNDPLMAFRLRNRAEMAEVTAKIEKCRAELRTM